MNPDSYLNENKQIKRCFQNTKFGELKLLKKEFSNRYNSLIESIDDAINNIPDKELTYVKLFYSILI